MNILSRTINRSVDKRLSAITAVVICVSVFYIVFTLIALSLHEWDPLWFVWLGEKYAYLDANGKNGYDGQFVYYLACYGSAAIPHLDNAPYRLQRILYPATVRMFSWGNSALVPWVMIVENILAIVLSTYLLAKWLSKENLSPWYALMYSIYIGTFMAYSRDLNEPLAFCLIILGITLWIHKKSISATIFLALAIFTKETTMLFIFGIIASALMQKRIKPALLASISILPFAMWQIYLFIQLGTIPITAGPSLELPLYGIIPHLTPEAGRLSSWLVVGLPALTFLCISSIYLLKGKCRSSATWWLLLHSIFVILMPLDVYDHIMHSGRNASGLVLSVLFLLPAIDKPFRIAWLGYWCFPTLVWLIPVLRWAPWLSQI